jgi:ferredoxin
MLVIDPDVCIDCGACIPECPVQAIHMQDDVPDKWKSFIALNAEKSKALPVITEKKTPLAKDGGKG